MASNQQKFAPAAEAFSPLRLHPMFRNVPAAALRRYESTKSSARYERGAVLFEQGQKCRGLFQLCAGKVRLTAAARNGKTAILRIARAGELLGLSETLLNLPYWTTAQVIDACSTQCISRDWLIAFMTQSAETAIRVAEQVSANHLAALDTLMDLKLSATSGQRFAQFILDSAEQSGAGSRAWHAKVSATHSEIAQTIGCSRETVTRLFKSFERSRLITVTPSAIQIERMAKLQELAQV
jgi:CRP/FNR family transcriptional regulator, cyclic AMP receptor protein